MTPRHIQDVCLRPPALALLGLALAAALAFVPPAREAFAQESPSPQTPNPQAPAPPAPHAPAEAPAALAYRATVVPTGVAELDSLLAAASPLLRLQERAPTDALGLAARIGAEPDRLRPAFESEGFWAGTAQVALAGSPPGSPPPTAGQLAATPGTVALEIRATPGPRYTLRHITTEGAAPIALPPGQLARAETVLAAESAALATWRAEGRPLAQVSRRVTVDHGARAMDVAFTATPGPRARFAPPTIAGTVAVNPAVAQRIAAIRLASWHYSPALLAQARADLLGLGPFGSVRTEPGAALDAEGRQPVNFHVTERPFRAITATAAYETNFGAAVSLAWEHRNLFGGAERLRVEAEVSRLGASFDRTNARLGASYRQPFPLGYPGTLIVNAAVVRQRLDSYDRDAIEGSILYEQRFGRHWTLSAGPTAEIGRAGLPGESLSPANLVGFATQARFDNTDSALDPRRGYRLRMDVTPSYSISRSQAYVPVRITGSTYMDLHGAGRTVLALRGSLGSLLNAEAEDVPVAQRFFSGGGGSVRGYSFQSIGPRDAQGRPRGGASVIEGSIELRQRFGEHFGAVAFVDAGGVGLDPFAPTDAMRVGAGIGARYYTAFGPVRADVAVPLVRQEGSNSFGLYIGIGHAF